MLIKIKVTTGAKKDSLKIVSEGRWEVSVREKPQQNQANARVLALVASRLGVRVNQIRIMSGHHSSSKTLKILK